MNLRKKFERFSQQVTDIGTHFRYEKILLYDAVTLSSAYEIAKKSPRNKKFHIGKPGSKIPMRAAKDKKS